MEQELVNKVFAMLQRQDFYDFYCGEFEAFVTGESHAPTEDEVKNRIKELLR